MKLIHFKSDIDFSTKILHYYLGLGYFEEKIKER